MRTKALVVSKWRREKSATTPRLLSARKLLMDITRNSRSSSASRNSETLRGLILAASPNSVRARSQFEKWSLAAWWLIDSEGTVLQQTHHRLQVRRPANFPAVRHPEDEIPETEVIQHELPQFLKELAGILVNKAGADFFGHGRQFHVGGLQNRGRMGIHVLDALDELHPGIFAVFALPGKAAIRNDPQQGILVVTVVGPSLFDRWLPTGPWGARATATTGG